MHLQVNLSKYLPVSPPFKSPSLKGVSTQLFFNREIKKTLETLLRNRFAPQETPLQRNEWGFYNYWHMIKERCPTIEHLYREIQERKSTVEKVKEAYRATIKENPNLLPYTDGLSDAGTYKLDPSRIHLVEDGISGTYFLRDKENNPRFVIKPLDEEPGCINNPKGFATPFGEKNPLRNYIPLYGSAFREAGASRIATLIGIGSIVPRTELAIFESKGFNDLSDRVESSELPRYLENAGSADREKLCSVQEFVANSKTLWEGLHELQASGLSDDEIAERFDRQDFEETNLLIWTTYDTDAHGANILVYPKGVDAIGNEILGMKKIDNGFCFPTENKQLRNNLQHHPCAKFTLSSSTKAKIAAMDPDQIARAMKEGGLESAIPAMRERVAYLKELATQDLTIGEINSRMARMDKVRS